LSVIFPISSCQLLRAKADSRGEREGRTALPLPAVAALLLLLTKPGKNLNPFSFLFKKRGGK